MEGDVDVTVTATFRMNHYDFYCERDFMQRAIASMIAGVVRPLTHQDETPNVEVTSK